MTPDRIKELRELFHPYNKCPDYCNFIEFPKVHKAIEALPECLDEIERLQSKNELFTAIINHCTKVMLDAFKNKGGSA